MPPASYTIAEARAQFSKLLDRARAGEEIVITKGREPHARIVPPISCGRREDAPLEHLDLPDDLFDQDDEDQAVVDAIAQGDAIESVTTDGDTDALLAAQGERVAEWNARLDR